MFTYLDHKSTPANHSPLQIWSMYPVTSAHQVHTFPCIDCHACASTCMGTLLWNCITRASATDLPRQFCSPYHLPRSFPSTETRKPKHTTNPSWMGTCAQAQAQAQTSSDEFKPQHLLFQPSFSDGFPEVIRYPMDDPNSVTAPDCGPRPSDTVSRGESADNLLMMTKEQRGWRRVIRNFTPA